MPAKLYRRAAGFLATFAGMALLALGGIGGWFYFSQERLIFHPSPLPASHEFSLPLVTEVKIPVEGATLSAAHFKHPDSKGMVFFLHGNGGTLATWLRSTDFYRRNRFDVFMIDYRGYGKSTGTIESEAQLHADVRAAWDSIAPQYAGKPRVILPVLQLECDARRSLSISAALSHALFLRDQRMAAKNKNACLHFARRD
jgi:uncharacterized protein